MQILARTLIAIYVGVLGLFLVLLSVVFLADTLELSGGAFALALTLMVMAIAVLVFTFPFAYYAAKYLEEGDSRLR